jgi:hypothetical protein
MRLWALAPVFTVLFLGTQSQSGPSAGAAPGPDVTSTGGPRAVLVVDAHPALGQQPAPDPSPASLAPASPSLMPVLQQQSDGTWQATVLVTGATGGCPLAANRYALDTTSPDMVLGLKGKPVPVSPQPGVQVPAGSCEVRLTFAALSPVPATATLVIDGALALPLAVSRNLGYPFFIGYPAGAGVLLALTLLLWVLRYLRVYNRQGVEQKPFGRDGGRRSPNPSFWEHEVYASGAWTLTDSWATNIAAAIGVVTTLLSLVAATSLLFRGVDLSRFVIVNAVAAGIAAAAPLVFGVLYARRLRLRPGVTSNAGLAVTTPTWPGSTATLKGQSAVTLAAGTLITIDAAALAPQYRPADLKQPGDQKPGDQKPHDEKSDARPGGDGTRAGEPKPARRMLVRLAAPASARLAADTAATPVKRGWIVLTPAETIPRVTLPAGTRVSLPGGRNPQLGERAEAGLPAGAAAAITAAGWDDLEVVIGGLAGGPWRLGDLEPRQHDGGQDNDGQDFERQGMRIDPPSGTTIEVPWGATVCGEAGGQLWAARLRPGSKVQVPAGSKVTVLARRVALPCGSDITVRGASVLRVGRPDPGVAMFTIPGSDVTSPHDDPSEDGNLSYPVWITPAAGAKITANGVADVTVPAGLRVSAPYRKGFELSARRTHFRLPQGADSLAGTVVMVIAAALVTMFGIGMQIGIAATLVGLSQADGTGRVLMWLLLLIGTVFTLHYSVTSIGTLADPEPGSTLSATTRSSFTL